MENDELEYNLRLQEKFNMILVEEIKRLREDCEVWNITSQVWIEQDDIL